MILRILTSRGFLRLYHCGTSAGSHTIFFSSERIIIVVRKGQPLVTVHVCCARCRSAAGGKIRVHSWTETDWPVRRAREVGIVRQHEIRQQLHVRKAFCDTFRADEYVKSVKRGRTRLKRRKIHAFRYFEGDITERKWGVSRRSCGGCIRASLLVHSTRCSCLLYTSPSPRD